MWSATDCKDCNERCEGCHSSCERYKKAKRKHDMIKHMSDQMKKKDKDISRIEAARWGRIKEARENKDKKMYFNR